MNRPAGSTKCTESFWAPIVPVAAVIRSKFPIDEALINVSTTLRPSLLTSTPPNKERVDANQSG